MLISAIAAMTPSRLIGAAGKLPWHIPEDLRHFKQTTAGHAVLMGRKTFDSIGRRPLPHRRNLVISREAAASRQEAGASAVEFFPTVDSAIAAVRDAGSESELFIVGGSQIFAAAMPLTQRLYITWITLTPEPAGDIFFPEIDFSRWHETGRRPLAPNAELVIYELN